MFFRDCEVIQAASGDREQSPLQRNEKGEVKCESKRDAGDILQVWFNWMVCISGLRFPCSCQTGLNLFQNVNLFISNHLFLFPPAGMEYTERENMWICLMSRSSHLSSRNSDRSFDRMADPCVFWVSWGSVSPSECLGVYLQLNYLGLMEHHFWINLPCKHVALLCGYLSRTSLQEMLWNHCSPSEAERLSQCMRWIETARTDPESLFLVLFNYSLFCVSRELWMVTLCQYAYSTLGPGVKSEFKGCWNCPWGAQNHL